MNVSEIFLKKIPLFLNEKYSDIFFDYLRNMKQILIENEKKNKISLFDILDSKSQKITKNKIYKYFNEIEKGINKEEKYNNKIYSHLELAYLKNKAKLYHRKLQLIAVELKKKTESCIEYYIRLCKLKIKQSYKSQSLDLNNNKIIIESKKKVLDKKKITSHLSNKILIKHEKKEKDKEKEKESDEELKFDEDIDKNKIINLFIGKFDINKFLKNQQKIELKKGGFVNAFIFKNIKQDDNSENNNIIHFHTPIKQKSHNKIFPIKKFNENSKNKKHNRNFITLESKLSNEESNGELNTKNLLEKKLKKSSILNKKNVNYNFLMLNNKFSNRRDKINFSSNSTFTYRNKVLSCDFQSTNTTSRLLKLKSTNSKNINITNPTFTKYNNNINLDFLSRKDLYY